MGNQLLATAITLIISMFIFTASCAYLIQEGGGVKNIIVTAGKEVKQIAKEINED